MERNERILKTIELNRVPLLPFEHKLAENALQHYIIAQNRLGNLLKESMNQTSETWHDNAPADAINNDSKMLANVAKDTMHILNESDIYDYEDTTVDSVTLGSLVSTHYDNGKQVAFFITGTTRDLEEYQDKIPKTGSRVVTVYSPIGRALLGAKVNYSVKFQAPNGRDITIHVDNIRQINLGE